MAITVGTLAIEIAVNERKALKAIEKVSWQAQQTAQKLSRDEAILRRADERWWRNTIDNRAAANKALVESRIAGEKRVAAVQESMQARLNALFPQRTALTAEQTRRTEIMYAGMFDSIASNQAVIERRSAMESARTERAAQRERTRIARAAAAERAAAERAQQRRAAAVAASGMGIGRGLGMIGLSGTVIGAFAFRGLVTAINDLQTLRQRLMQVADSQEQARMLFDRMAEAAGRLRVPVQDATELFVKLRQSNAALGLTYGETQKVTEAFSAALRISGASGQTAASALLQFGQAMAKGQLDGDEFRTVAENASEVLRVLERRFAVSRGEILKWREQGKLTAKMMADALIAEYDNLIERVNRLPPTLSQAATSFRNSVMQMISDSKDLEEATNRFAVGIVELGNMLKENGPLIRGMAKLALELTAVYAAMKTIQMLGGIPKVLAGAVAGGPFALVALLGAVASGAFLIGRALRDIAKAKEEAAISDAIKQRADAYNQLQQNFRRELTHGKDTAKILQAKAAAEADRKLIIDEMNRATLELGRAELAFSKSRSFNDGERLQSAKQLFKERKQLYDLTVAAERLTESGGGAVTPPVDVGKVVSDDVFARLRELESRLPNLSRLAEQIGLDIEKAVAGSLGVRALDRVQFLMDNYEALADVISDADRELIRLALAQTAAEVNRIQTLAARTRAEEELLVALRERLRLLGELAQKSEQTAGGREQQTREDRGVGLDDRFDMRLERQLFTLLRAGPGDVITAFFEGLGQRVDEGGETLAEKMRQALGNLFSGVGQNMLQRGMGMLMDSLKGVFGQLFTAIAGPTTVLGKFLETIKAFLIANPLLAGLGLVAVGGAMLAYGKSLGGSTRAAIGMGGLGGGIGGLDIGGRQEPIPFVFQGRPYQSPMQGMGGVPEGRNTVNVNATIIGPNDPQAQRQIATLVNNAARRGLVTGPAARTA
jgi:tape measure domain-containing protein